MSCARGYRTRYIVGAHHSGDITHVHTRTHLVDSRPRAITCPSECASTFGGGPNQIKTCTTDITEASPGPQQQNRKPLLHKKNTSSMSRTFPAPTHFFRSRSSSNLPARRKKTKHKKRGGGGGKGGRTQRRTSTDRRRRRLHIYAIPEYLDDKRNRDLDDSMSTKPVRVRSPTKHHQ